MVFDISIRALQCPAPGSKEGLELVKSLENIKQNEHPYKIPYWLGWIDGDGYIATFMSWFYLYSDSPSYMDCNILHSSFYRAVAKIFTTGNNNLFRVCCFNILLPLNIIWRLNSPPHHRNLSIPPNIVNNLENTCFHYNVPAINYHIVSTLQYSCLMFDYLHCNEAQL